MPILAPFYPIIIVFLLCTNGIAGIMWYVKSKDATVYHSQLDTCRAEHQSFVSQVEAQGRIAEQKAKQIEEQNRRTADETAKGWAAALDTVRRDADKRVRLILAGRGASGSQMSPVPRTAPGTDAASEEPVPTPEGVIAACLEDTLTLAWLQYFNRQTSHREQ